MLELIRARHAEGSRPGARSDPFRLALAIEGGSMRSVISAGMTLALDSLGFRDGFDDVYGASAGSLIGAYLVAGQARLTPTIYYEDLCSRKFVNVARILTRRPVMSLDFLFEVMDRSKPLDWDAVLRSPIRLHPLATLLEERRVVDLGGSENVADLRGALRAAATMPVIGGPPAELRGASYLDAGLFESFPFRPALRDGCTHALVLRTRPAGKGPPGVSRATRLFLERLVGIDPELIELAATRPIRYAEEGRELAALAVATLGERSTVCAIAPDDTLPSIDRLSLDARRVKQNAVGGAHAVYTRFDLESPGGRQVL